MAWLVASVALGLAAIGCVIAALFERDTFGGEPDREPRAWYVIMCCVGLGASIAALGLSALLAGRAGRSVAATCATLGVVAALALWVVAGV